MTHSLEGRIAIVTGAGGRIGRAAAKLLAERGAVIVAVDAREDALASLAAELPATAKAMTIAADVTDEAAVRAAVDRARDHFGRIHVLFNNAGIEGLVAPITEYPVAAFLKVLQVNVLGVMLWMKHVIPVMVAEGGGSIVNTASVAGVSGARRMPAYAASKHAVVGLTRSAALDWAAKGVRINAVAPGPIASPMMASIEEGLAPGAANGARQRIAAAIPAGRYGEAEEVARVVAFLASDEARFVNGSVYTVDGGLTA